MRQRTVPNSAWATTPSAPSLMDRVEEVKYHGKQAIDKCAMLVGLACGMMVVLGGLAYAVEQVMLFKNRHDIQDVDVEYGSLKLWDVDRAALILYNDSDFLHTGILKAAKYANLANEVEFFKLDCEEHEDACKRVENHETKTRPEVYFMHKGDATESWMEDYLKGEPNRMRHTLHCVPTESVSMCWRCLSCALGRWGLGPARDPGRGDGVAD